MDWLWRKSSGLWRTSAVQRSISFHRYPALYSVTTKPAVSTIKQQLTYYYTPSHWTCSVPRQLYRVTHYELFFDKHQSPTRSINYSSTPYFLNDNSCLIAIYPSVPKIACSPSRVSLSHYIQAFFNLRPALSHQFLLNKAMSKTMPGAQIYVIINSLSNYKLIVHKTCGQFKIESEVI